MNKLEKDKKVLVVAHIFPPVGGSGVQRTLKFVKYLRKYNWEPVVVTTGNTIYPFEDESLMDEIPKGIKIIRIDEEYILNNEKLNNIIDLLTGLIDNAELINTYINILNNDKENIKNLIKVPDMYIIWASRVLSEIGEKINFEIIDLIYSTSAPYSNHVIAYYLKDRYQKPWVADFRDEWTNNPYFEFNKNNILHQMSYLMEDNIVHTADKVITVSPLIRENYIKIFNLKDEKVKTITNGYDEEDFQNITDNKEKNNCFTIAYNGIFYLEIIPTTFLKAVNYLIKKELIDRNKIKINFTCSEEDNEWCQYIKDHNLTDVVNLIGYLNHEDSLKKANKADLLLLIIGKGREKRSVYSSKVFEYLRLNIPVLSLAPEDGVVDKLLKKTGRGVNLEYDDVEGIAEAVLKYYRSWEENSKEKLGVSKEIKKYERRQLTKELVTVFNNLTIEQRPFAAAAKNKKKIKKVLFIQNTPCIRTYKVAKVLKQNGINVDVVYLSNHPKKFLNKLDLPFNNIYKLGNFNEMIDFINKSDYDLLYSSNEPDYLSVLFKVSNKPLVHDTHDMMSLRQKLTPEQIIFEYLANIQADGNIYVSSLMKKIAHQKYNYRVNKPVMYLPNLLLSEFIPDSYQEKITLKDNETHCVYEGGLLNKKDSHRYIEDYFLQLAENKIHVHFYTSDFWSCFNNYYKKLENGSEFIHWEGSRSQKDLIIEMTKYDVGLCLFNINQTNKKHLEVALPNKMWDYLAAGLPVLVSDVQEMRKFVRNNNMGNVYDSNESMKKQVERTKNIKIEENFLLENKLTMDQRGKQIIEFLEKVKERYYEEG